MDKKAGHSFENNSDWVIVLPNDEQKLKTIRYKLSELSEKLRGLEKQNKLEEMVAEQHPDASLPDKSKRELYRSDTETKLDILTTLLDSGHVGVHKLYPDNDEKIYFARAVAMALKNYINGDDGMLNL